MVIAGARAEPWSVPPPSAALAAPPASRLAILRWCPFWPGLLLLTLIVPTELSFTMGSLRLTAYRVVLLAAFLPALSRLLGGRAGPVGAVDVLLLLHLILAFAGIAFHHGTGTAVESGGVRLLELGGGFLVARAYVVGEREFRGFVAMIGFTLCLVAPFVVVESLTGEPIAKAWAARLQGGHFYSEVEPRFGLHRAYGPFDHPILLGVFAATGLAMLCLPALPRLGAQPTSRLPRWAVITGAICSMSAGALAALALQTTLLVWERATRRVARRWHIFGALVAAFYMAIDLLSNRSPIHVFLHYLTFNAHTAYYRMTIFDWGMREVWAHPLIGIGFNDWTRPAWMHSASMDNFWLLQAVTFGIPAFLALALATLFALTGGACIDLARLQRLRTGWVISMLGMIAAGMTVHFWNSLFVHFALMLGAGIWFRGLSATRSTRRVKETSHACR